ncbi:MAG: phosphotransferase [Pseudomonadota bacterium]
MKDSSLIWSDRSEAQFREASAHVLESWQVFDRRPEAVAMKARSRTFGDVFVKYYPQPGGAERVATEFEALRHYSDAMRDVDGFGVLRPITTIEDKSGGGALVAEWIRLHRGDRWFKLSMPFNFARRHGIRRVAKWLQLFHTVGQTEPAAVTEALDRERLLTEFEVIMSAYRGSAHPSLDVSRKLDLLSESVDRVSGESVPCSRLHADFMPQNTFISRNQVVGFDFEATDRGPVLRDIGNFASNTLWMSYSSMSWRQIRIFKEDTELFLESYFAGLKVNPALLRLFMIEAMVKKATGVRKKGMNTTQMKRWTAQRHLNTLGAALDHFVSDEIVA